jgi:hypothetical protein
VNVRWGVFAADKTEDGRTHIAPMDRETLSVAHPHDLAEYCACRPRVAAGLVVHDTMSDTAMRLLLRKALVRS